MPEAIMYWLFAVWIIAIPIYLACHLIASPFRLFDWWENMKYKASLLTVIEVISKEQNRPDLRHFNAPFTKYEQKRGF